MAAAKEKRKDKRKSGEDDNNEEIFPEEGGGENSSGKIGENNPEKKDKNLTKKTIEKGLMEIYKGQDGEMPDMTKIYHKKRSKLKIALIGLVIFFALLAGLSWAGFFFFGGNRSFSGEKVDLTVDAPEKAASGETVEYVIRYENQEDVPLGQASIEVRMPENFVVSESSPSPSEGQNFWQLGSLAAKESGEIKIKGVLRGPLDSLQTMQVVLTYKPGDFNSEFQKIATGVTKLEQAVFEIELSGPERILAKAETTFKIKYKNISEESVSGIRISIDGPEDFSFKEKEEDGEREITSWDIPELAAGEEKEMEFKGSFGEAAEGEREFKVKIGFVDGDKFYVQKENTFKTDVLIGAMLVTLVANGDSKDRSMNFGDTLNYAITYQNKDKGEISNVEIKMIFETTSHNNKMLMDWSAIKDDADGSIVGTQVSEEIRRGTITWNKNQISGLAKMAPGEEGTINFQIKIKSFSEMVDWGVKDFEIKNLVEVKIEGAAGEGGEEIIESNQIIFKMNSDLGLATEARYFNEDDLAVGSGPLPPKVGETTAYRIFWKVTNSLHEIENLRVSTILPENIKWSNKSERSAGDISFDEATREVSWTLNRMPLDIQEITADFEVTVTPTGEDKGNLLTLISETKMQATDKSTGGTINKIRGALTSNLDNDPSGKGKGIVE